MPTISPIFASILDDIKQIITQIAESFGINIPGLAAQIFCFSVVIFVLYRFAFKPVLATIEQRQKEIEGGLKNAEEMKRQLAAAQETIAKEQRAAALTAQKIIDDAGKIAAENSAREQAAATEQANALIERAKQSIDLEKEKVMGEAREEIARLVVETTRKVLSRELSEDERARYNKSAADELLKN